jgi:hypothetical protein
MFDHRLIGAEALKLYRRPAMIALCVVLTLGIDLVVYVVTGVQHASDPSKYGPAGGLDNYQGSIALLTMLMLVAGSIIGSTAGAQDIETGVFRDLAATGRSRLALFGSRVPGAWTAVLPIAALAAAVATILSFALADGVAGPDAGTIVAGTWLSIEGAPRELPQTLDLSAYRIVQEALANVLKHAVATHARVTVAYGPDALALTISDSGGDAPAKVNGAPGGHGLVGMRERVALFGGTLDAGPRPGRGFEVGAPGRAASCSRTRRRPSSCAPCARSRRATPTCLPPSRASCSTRSGGACRPRSRARPSASRR